MDTSDGGGGVGGAEAFLIQIHQDYPELQHDCYEAHCTYGVVKNAIRDPQARVGGFEKERRARKDG